MSFIGPLKPLLTTLLLPPAGPLLLVFLGLLLAKFKRRWAWGLVFTGTLIMWLACCNATAYGLNRLLLKTYPAVTAAQRQDSQAIVVLGGGVDLYAPEYGETILGGTAHERLLYGAHLARQSKLPLIYSGGIGWGAPSDQNATEAAVAASTLKRELGMSFTWVDDQSRDTRENAQRSFEQLSKQGITRILLVTNDWHMQRSVRNFEQAGFVVQPAPMGYTQPPLRLDTDFLPSGGGLRDTRRVLHEALGRLMT
jgi:uncharacterized SAM-binding protein YcdF (DUF218 family)